jgi:hypothetical protein
MTTTRWDRPTQIGLRGQTAAPEGSAPNARLHLRVLGPLELRRDDVVVTAPELRRERVRHSWATCSSTTGRPGPAITSELWPDLDDAAAHHRAGPPRCRNVAATGRAHRRPPRTRARGGVAEDDCPAGLPAGSLSGAVANSSPTGARDTAPGAALGQEQQVLLRRALTELADRQRRLMEPLVATPPLGHQDISARLGMPVGSISPTRARTSP